MYEHDKLLYVCMIDNTEVDRALMRMRRDCSAHSEKSVT